MDALDVDNRRAWELVHTVCSRFLGTGGALGPVVVRLTEDLSQDDFADIIERANVIFDVLVPPPKKSSS